MIFNNINNILHLDQSQFFYTQMVVEMPTSPTAHSSTAASKLPNIAACHILRGRSAEKNQTITIHLALLQLATVNTQLPSASQIINQAC